MDVISADGPRALLVTIIGRALRSEVWIRINQEERKPTGFYAGRRSGAISDAADLVSMIYGGKKDSVRRAITNAVKEEADKLNPEEHQKLDPRLNQEAAIRIATAALLAD